MGVSQSRSVSESVQSSNKADAQVSPQNIRQVILALLSHCEVPYAIKPYDQFLHDRCLGVCEERGYPGIGSGYGSDQVHGEPSLLPFLPTGVWLAAEAYGHLKSDLPRLIYIALYTAFITYLDDLFKRDVESVALFGQRLIRGERQGHHVLDGLAHAMNDAETQFGRTAANIIIYDTLGYMNSLLIDHETQEVNLSRDALGFPTYMRLLSGVPSCFAVFIFPPDMPLLSYIQSIPEIRDYICYMNDVLSFYKEEIRGEEDNYISLVATSQRLAKYDVLQKLADDLARTTEQVNKILKEDPAAFHAWSTFKAGYIYFHTSNVRYKLDQLNLA
ncbi:hypothetical protein D9619_007675 [Psilocybe cf. subviscida]|uniref:Terpenoid synthase n=1 Tax=Psilocybe cf. subviscida TaxID=2480587 RepID=A0A8H5AUB2_9AGAR|nr:hypothetical protein D9619_007675 [Psilocybe cf. subviscida]